ncbi:MAG TPA: NAD(P)/FAD-dependent oxidoreductase [Solirubrobacteraceae bacterium]|nr:NAD(P)/FAD-dependent oxidoreductase [Solirubrobacteraceae bacterium]
MVDAVVVGSGPNGLAAALTLALAGLSVEVFEAAPTAGGGCRTEQLTLPGFVHDVCSAVHPMLAASPFFRELALPGVRVLTPEVAYAHPLDGGRAAAIVREVEDTAARLGRDRRRYEALMAPLVRDWQQVIDGALAPQRSLPRAPVAMVRFGLRSVWPARAVASMFSTDEARAVLAGACAHSMQPLGAALTAGFGIVLGLLAHAVGWPVVEGGSARIAESLVIEIEACGGRVYTDARISDLSELPDARATLLDTSPRGLLELAGDRVPTRIRSALERFRHGPGVFKLDWALDGPVPWSAEACRRTATVHVGGTLEEVARCESEVACGRVPEQPFCIVVQPCVVDPSRAPAGKHTLWGYCHVPPGCPVDMTEAIEAQIERFAPGFRELVLARAAEFPADVERRNPNYIGGDINGGAATAWQTFFRPTVSWNPYRAGPPGVYLCSASTPPGGGVHGMCGVFAARTALRDLRD